METSSTYSILIVESDRSILRGLSFGLESSLGIEVIEAEDQRSASEFASRINDLSLILICDVEKFQPLVSQVLSAQTASSDSGTSPSVILGVSQKIKDPAILFHPKLLGIAERSNLAKEVSNLICDKFFKGKILEKVHASEYIRIRTDLLLMTTPLISDVYIRLGPDHYLKIFQQGDVFDEGDFHRYTHEKKIEYFYVSKHSSRQFSGQLTTRVEEMLASGKATYQELDRVAHDMQAATYSMIQACGVTEEVKEMTKTNVNVILKTVQKSPGLAEILERMKKETSEYIVGHSMALAQVACALAGQVSWLSGITFQKLILAAMFHDLSLKDNEVARLSTLEEAKGQKGLFLSESIEDFKLHPIRGVDMVNQVPDLPADVDTIIRQHHERPDGSGFPAKITTTHFAPLSSLFIIAHDFLDYSYQVKGTPNVKTFIEQYPERWSVGYFKKILLALHGSGKL